MLELFNPPLGLGLEETASTLKAAEVVLKGTKVVVQRLLALPLPLEPDELSQLPLDKAFVVTGLEGGEVITRSLELPLTKAKDIEGAVPFQADTLLPYPVENAILTHLILGQTKENSELTVLAVPKDLLQKHLDRWQTLNIEPEVVSCLQNALCLFGTLYSTSEQPFFVVHLNETTMTCILMKQGKLLAAHTEQEGLNALKVNAEDVGFQRLQMALTRMVYGLTKAAKGDHPAGIVVTGECLTRPDFAKRLSEKLAMPLLELPDVPDGDPEQQEWPRYGVSIGLAMAGLAPPETMANFRKQEFAYPTPWKHIKTPLALYFGLCLLLSLALYFFGQAYNHSRISQLKQEYVEMLDAMHKSYEGFEKAYLAKNPVANEMSGGNVMAIEQLSREDLLDRMAFLQKDLQAMPDSFPLFPNLPRVSDVLAWLSTHPHVVGKEGEAPRMQLESMSYTMLKRPEQTKKQEKYQVKVELELSTPSPTWAREFHDALIAPNEIVDPKGEVKWSANRGKYRTSFYLKDKTFYPNP